jgi:hypothetical protein
MESSIQRDVTWNIMESSIQRDVTWNIMESSIRRMRVADSDLADHR